MSGAIAVFVKTPGLSPVKTRLAEKLGQQNAEAFHLAASRSVSAVVQGFGLSNDVKAYYAVAESAAIQHNYWQNLPCLWQGEGGLGERMAHIYQTLLLKHDFVLLVGADSPQLSTIDLASASAWLVHDQQARFAFGPSVDGGFWLMGGNSHMPNSLWTEVIYSHADTGAQFYQRMKTLGEVKTLPILCDVDEAKDLICLREALLNLAEPLPAQKDMLRFLDTLPTI